MSQEAQGYYHYALTVTDAVDNGADTSTTSTVLVEDGFRGTWLPSEHEVQMQERRQQHEVMQSSKGSMFIYKSSSHSNSNNSNLNSKC
jgi:hypothetical protein